MPYFRSANLLFIHIPKTGGTSIELYLSKKYNIPLNERSLYGVINPHNRERLGLRAITYQHLLYETLLKHRHFSKLISYPFRILTVVRNPYERLVSDLFYYQLIHIHSSTDKVFNAILYFLRHPEKYDNHTLPQHTFLKGIQNIKTDILRTETLTQDMRRIGYTDFDFCENKNRKINEKNSEKGNDYMKYLDSKSIKLINIIYQKDFETFGYEIK